MIKRLLRIFTFISLAICFGCTKKQEYTYAYAQEMDNSILKNEHCRESLADSIYLEENAIKTHRVASSNVFLFKGIKQNYRIYGFKNLKDCEIALTGMVIRNRK